MNTMMSSAPTINSATLRDQRLAGAGPTLVDVRTPAEFETAHIPGAWNLPLDELDRACADIAALDAPVVLVCQSGKRAEVARQRILAATGVKTQVLEGGVLAWETLGGDIQRGEARWELERQVRLVAGSLVLGSILASLAFPPAKWLAGAVGAGLTFAALSNTCAMATLLGKLPYNRGTNCSIEDTARRMREAHRS